MARSYASTVIDAPADVVWHRIRDFDGLGTWHSGIGVATCEIEEGKAGDQVGAVRRFVFPDGARFRERLLACSDAERAYSYTFLETPFEVVNHRATIRVTPVTDEDRSFVEWWTTFDCADDRRPYWEAFFAGEVFRPGFESLKEHLAAERLATA